MLMTAQNSAYPGDKPPYEPTLEQQARENALRRFNRLTVYLPLTLVALIVLALFVLMLVRVVTHSPESQAYHFLSGLADLILIFTLMPMLLLCAVGPALFGFLLYRANQRRSLPPAERRGKLQTLFWRLDQMLDTVQAALRDRYLEKAARPLVTGHAYAAAVQAVWHYLRKTFNRSKERPDVTT